MALEAADTTAKLDPFELAADDRPYASYARIRNAGPLLRAGPGMWAVPRYREVAALLRDTRIGPFRFQEIYQRFRPGASAAGGPARALLEGILVAARGADHARVRKVMARAVGSRMTASLKARIEARTVARLTEARERGTIDLVSLLAYPLPAAIMGDLVGIPADDCDMVARHVLALSKMFSPIVPPADEAAADAAILALRPYIGALIERCRQHPGEDLISDMATAAGGGTLTSVEAVDNTIFAIFAGLETSISLIAGGCAALAQFPDQFARLRRHPERVGTAIDEFLRYDAPTQITARVVEQPIEIGGRMLRQGRIVLLLLGSANRDEREFPDPDRLDIERTPNPHVSFGGGAHFCLGAALAQVESAIVFTQLAAAFSVFELAGEVVTERCATPRVFSSVPVRVR